MTPYEGLRALPPNAAYEYFEEKTQATLEAGKLADLVMLGSNPLTIDPTTIKEGKTI
ncbi:MAG: amidohydrolase family protein [Betaproteobacteria bacterium]